MLERTGVRTGVIARLRWSPLGPYLDTLAPPCTSKDMPRVVSSVFCVPLRSLPNGSKDKAMPSARWMQTSDNGSVIQGMLVEK
jgi:hypothetical protein